MCQTIDRIGVATRQEEGFRGELGLLNCDDACMCVVNKQFELLEFVSESVYVDLQYDEISLTVTAGFVWC